MPSTSYYIVGHPDDTYLFRGEQFYDDLHEPTAEVVQIVMTAGDAGRLDDWWVRRERGCVQGIRASTSPQPVLQDRVDFAGHPITRYRGPGWYAYFLRIPDGNLNGNGFPATGSVSLSQVRAGTTNGIGTMDESTYYVSWNDVQTTVNQIVGSHRTPEGGWINTSDPESRTNPGDHPDHYMSGRLAEAAASAHGLYKYAFVGYDTRYRTANLSGQRLGRKRFLFSEYGFGGSGMNEQEWGWWGSRSYGRVL